MSERLRKALVCVRNANGDAVGAGFLIAGGKILTCSHVIAEALDPPQSPDKQLVGRVTVGFPWLASADGLQATVSACLPLEGDESGDITGLVLDGNLPSGAEPVSLVPAGNRLWGQEFRTLGFTKSSPGGIWASGTLRDIQGTGWLQMETGAGPRIQPGFSGAPVWVEELDGVAGMVVAFLAAGKPPGDRVAFCIPSDLLMEAWPDVLKPPPYRGLAPFREEDRQIFFGRNDVVDRLTGLVRDHALMLVHGQSGCGKSSVVAAGLSAQLRAEGWLVVRMSPGRSPSREIAHCLVQAIDSQLTISAGMSGKDDLADRIRRGQLAYVLAEAQRRAGSVPFLLVIDQSEEIFTLCNDVNDRKAFLEGLAQVSAERGGGGPPLRVILTMRTDFLAQVSDHAAFTSALNHDGASVLLGGLTRQQLREAVEGPIQVRNVTLENGLVERILEEIGDGVGQLPLLAELLRQLWDLREGNCLTHKAYGGLGGVKNALSRHAEKVYEGLSPTEQERVRAVLIKLVGLGKGVPDSLQIAHRSELSPDDWKLVQHLASERLVVTDRNRLGEQTVQLVHETLIRNWECLSRWVSQGREFLAWREWTGETARLWEAEGQDADRRLVGRPSEQAMTWCLDNEEDIDDRIKQFVIESYSWELRRKNEYPMGRSKKAEVRQAFWRATQAAETIRDNNRRTTTLLVVLLAEFRLCGAAAPFRALECWRKMRNLRPQLSPQNIKRVPTLRDSGVRGMFTAMVIAIGSGWGLFLWAAIASAASQNYLILSTLIAAITVAAVVVLRSGGNLLATALSAPFLALIAIALAVIPALIVNAIHPPDSVAGYTYIAAILALLLTFFLIYPRIQRRGRLKVRAHPLPPFSDRQQAPVEDRSTGLRGTF